MYASKIKRQLINFICKATTLFINTTLGQPHQRKWTHPADHLQIPKAGLLLAGRSGVCSSAVDQVGMFSRCADHLSPSHSLLQFHQALLVLVAFHQDTSHLDASEPLALCHWHVILQYTSTSLSTQIFPLHYCFVQRDKLITGVGKHHTDCTNHTGTNYDKLC